MTNSFDEIIEEMFGIRGLIKSEEDIERDRARRIEQIRIDAPNEVVTSERERRELEKIIQENRRDLQFLRSKLALEKERI